MQENIIHLMKTDNQGNDLTELNDKFIQKICRLFGGATMTEGKGLWYSVTGVKFEDDILRVVTAFDPSASCDKLDNNRQHFENLAYEYMKEAMQESVYIVLGGYVKFIN
jgi:hypothetical protein